MVVTAPILSFTKTADVTTADPGDTIVYTLEYENSGTGWATLVEITDTIPADTTFVSSDPAYDDVTGDTYTWNIGDLAPGGSGTITITVTVDVGTADETLLHNTGTLDYADANGNYYTQLSDYADVVVTAPIMTFTKTADVSEADPGDTIVYTLEYENIGTGDASDVTIVDTLPVDVTLVWAIPPASSLVGNVATWYIGTVPSGDSGKVDVFVRVNVGTPDQTLLHNEATLDYSDANGNFIEQLNDSADVVVTAPVMTLSKEAGEVTVSAYVIADFTLRVAGEKWHDVVLTLYDGEQAVAVASVYRIPGNPDEQSVTIYNVTVDVLSGSFTAVIVYTPLDDAINGQWWGADPAWLILTLQDGSEIRLHHTFNVRHNETWIWTVEDFRPYLKGVLVTFEADFMYTITYENIGTGDASNVWVNDTFPEDTVLVDSNPAYDLSSGNTYMWNIGMVPSGAVGYIYINASYIITNTTLKDLPDGKVLTNVVTLDYSDANGNFIERLTAYADVVIVIPEDGLGAGGDGGMATGTWPNQDDVGEGYGSSVPEPVLNSPTDYAYFEGEPIHFSARAIYSGDEASLTFQWDFGDGSASTGRELDHIYSDDGRYFVVLTVSDTDGNADQLTVRIIVLNVDPAAQINSPYGGEVGDTIHMSAQANDPGDDTLTFEWNFGDGQSAIGEKVTHVYLYPGLFSVTLTVHDGDGGKAIIKSIAVIREIIHFEPPTDDEVEPDETPETPEAEETPVSEEETEQSETEEGTSSPTVVWRRPPSSYWDVVTLTTDHGDASDELPSEKAATWSSPSFAILLILGQCIALLVGTFVWIQSRRLR